MSRWEIYFSVWQVRSLKLPRIVYCLLWKLPLPERQVQFLVVVFQLSVLFFPGSWLMKWKHKLKISIGICPTRKSFLYRPTVSFIIFFCFLSIIRSSFEHFSDCGIPHFPVDMMTSNNTGYSCLVKNCNWCSCNSSRPTLSCCSRFY